MDKKTFSLGFIIFFVVLTYYLYTNNDSIANIIANDGVQGTIWYFVSNPAYLLLFLSVVYFNSEAGILKNAVGALMIIYASDIISYPRLSPAGLGDNINLLASLDGLFFNKMLAQGFSYSTLYSFYYLILPIVLIIGAISILGIHNFFKHLTGGKV
mgnify:CR=1 FL=1